MQAGRELDALVAGALKGWEPGFIEHLKENDGWILIPHYSTDWRKMGELVTEAAEEGIFLSYEHACGGYVGIAYDMRNVTTEEVEPIFSDDEHRAVKEAPQAISRAYLKAKGIAI
ncbi:MULTISPECIES: hypothetical protein [unclassified Brevibacillus]|uniref:hypothetical protein n=1 Tax=unclassified Brevibacillus TaxID=2684853 RepID=UPI003561E6A1